MGWSRGLQGASRGTLILRYMQSFLLGFNKILCVESDRGYNDKQRPALLIYDGDMCVYGDYWIGWREQ